MASRSGHASSETFAESAEIPVIPPTLVTGVVGGEGAELSCRPGEGAELSCRRGDGEGVRCRLGGRLLAGLALVFVRLES